jgi:hypothetical protein
MSAQRTPERKTVADGTAARVALRTRVLIALTLTTCLASAQAVDLDAPITPPPITIASEVDRGMKSAPDNLAMSVVEYSDAISVAIKRNKDANRDTEPFEFGLYYAAWHRLWSSLSIGVYREKTARNLITVDAKIFFRWLVKYRKTLVCLTRMCGN